MLPIAVALNTEPDATVVAPEITRTGEPAAVVLIPTETPPAPEIEMALSVCVELDDAAVVLPIAETFWTVPLAGATDCVAEIIRTGAFLRGERPCFTYF